MTALILSGSYLESNRYLQSEGIRGSHATNATTVASAFFTQVIELPSFDKRPDRFTVRAALKRRLRGKGQTDWTKLESWTPPVKPEPLRIDPNVFLFGDLNGEHLSPAEEAELIAVIEEVDAPSAEDEQLQDLVAPKSEKIVQDKGSEPIRTQEKVDAESNKPAAKPKRPRKPTPAPPKTVTSSIDDLFGDD